jgi:hypothetical protein
MAEQRCAYCANCTPDSEHEQIGHCRIIGAAVVANGTGQNCKLFRVPGQETVRVRVAVAVMPDLYWKAFGRSGVDDVYVIDDVADYFGAGAAVHWLEADLPVPVSQTVEAEVVS